MIKQLRQLFIRADDEFEKYESASSKLSLPWKLFYLFMYLAPGLLVFVLINIEPVYQFLISFTGLSGKIFQLVIFFFVTYVWHIVVPIFFLRKIDKLPWTDVWKFLGLNRFDWKGVVVALPIFFILTTLLSYPYMIYVARPLRQVIDQVPFFSIPDYSLFSSYEALYSFPAIVILLMLIGNLVGEELYFRGYLLRKSAFLGKYNLWVNGILFAVYHFWQIPQTWPLFGLTIAFTLLMIWRKNLYPLILFHAMLNFAWPGFYYLIFKSFPYL